MSKLDTKNMQSKIDIEIGEAENLITWRPQNIEIYGSYELFIEVRLFLPQIQ